MHFPLWTNVMRAIFNSPYGTAISALVDGNFAELKNSILKHESKPMTVDRFIVTHIESIDASTKIARSHQIVEDNNNHILDNLIHNSYLSPLSSSKSIVSETTICTINEEKRREGLLNQQLKPLQHVEINSNQKLKWKRTTKYVDNCPEIDRILKRSRMRSFLKALILNSSTSSQVIHKKKPIY